MGRRRAVALRVVVGRRERGVRSDATAGDKNRREEEGEGGARGKKGGEGGEGEEGREEGASALEMAWRGKSELMK